MVFCRLRISKLKLWEVGARFIFLKNDNVLYRVSGSALMGKVNGEFAVLPKFQGDILLNFEKNVDIQHSYYFLAGTEITPQFVAQKQESPFRNYRFYWWLRISVGEIAS